MQGQRVTTGMLTRAVVEHDYLQVIYLAGLWACRTGDGTVCWAGGQDAVRAAEGAAGPVTCIGMERPDGL